MQNLKSRSQNSKSELREMIGLNLLKHIGSNYAHYKPTDIPRKKHFFQNNIHGVWKSLKNIYHYDK